MDHQFKCKKKIEGKRAIQILEENIYEFFLNFGVRKKSLTIFQKSETNTTIDNFT